MRGYRARKKAEKLAAEKAVIARASNEITNVQSNVRPIIDRARLLSPDVMPTTQPDVIVQAQLAVLAMIDDLTEPVAPPTTLWQRILAAFNI
jgi:hypothetical protein